ncbi:hypothetical protein FUMI01_09280 [Flavobacterium sp. UMI-01]|nr:hypothetical protein FUMI01_09280 [Flavobacterium sp. UMI-01]
MVWSWLFALDLEFNYEASGWNLGLKLRCGICDLVIFGVLKLKLLHLQSENTSNHIIDLYYRLVLYAMCGRCLWYRGEESYCPIG